MNRWTDDDLRRLATDLESPMVERKRQVTKEEKQKIQHTLCAFANDILGMERPGVLFIGLEDDGRPSGRPVDDGLLKDLGNFVLSGALHPKPAHEVRRLTLADGSECAVLTIEPFPQPPVRYNGDVFVRRGPQVNRATPEDERRLTERNRAANLPFELRPVLGARLEDLDPVLADRYLEQAIGEETRMANERPLAHQLQAQRLLSTDRTPTVAGVLLIGQDPAFFLPQARIQLVLYAGPERTDPILDQERIEGPLVFSVPWVLTKLGAWNRHPMDTDQARHVIRPAVPDRALREAVINAIVHRDYELQSPIMVRWYSDRVDIISPGGPMPPVTPANFGHTELVSQRNDRLAEAMLRLGHAQRHGMGISQIRQTMKANGNPDPRFEAGEHHVQVVLPLRKD